MLLTGIAGVSAALEDNATDSDISSGIGETSTASSAIPDLVGVWNIEAVGTVLLKSETPGEFTHFTEGQTNLTAKAEITEQIGRIIKGTLTAPLGKPEKIIGVIHPDNRIVRMVDMDGMIDGQIIDQDTIQTLYRHSTEHDAVIAVGTWKRQTEKQG